MLNRELCQVLAEQLPEVREHRLQVGDWYYHPNLTFCPETQVLVWYSWDYIGSEVGTDVPEHGNVSFLKHPYTEAIWCPRLDQLLDLAFNLALVKLGRQTTNRLADLRLMRWDRFESSGTPTPNWLFDWSSIALPLGVGPTPEEAVANWLLRITT